MWNLLFILAHSLRYTSKDILFYLDWQIGKYISIKFKPDLDFMPLGLHT